MIQVKLKDILNRDVLNDISKKELKARAAFKLARIIREVNSEYELFQESRQKIIEKYVAKNEDGTWQTDKEQNYFVPQKDIVAYNSDITDLLNTTVELNVEALTLEDIEDANFTVEQMQILILFM